MKPPWIDDVSAARSCSTHIVTHCSNSITPLLTHLRRGPVFLVSLARETKNTGPRLKCVSNGVMELLQSCAQSSSALAMELWSYCSLALSHRCVLCMYTCVVLYNKLDMGTVASTPSPPPSRDPTNTKYYSINSIYNDYYFRDFSHFWVVPLRIYFFRTMDWTCCFGRPLHQICLLS